MKNNIYKSIKYLVVIFTMISFYSCSKGELFTGSPVDTNLDFVTLQGSITTPDENVVANQSFPVTISLGTVTFPMDVSVEAIAFLPNLNKRSRKAFIIPAGQTSITSTMVAPSGDATSTLPFNLDLKLYLSAITTAPEVTPKGFVGKQYSIVSDTIYLGYGDTSIPGTNSKRLAIRFDFEGPFSGPPGLNNFNNLNIVLKKNGVSPTSQSSMQGVSPVANSSRPLFGTLTNPQRYETLYFLDDAEQDLKLTFMNPVDKLANVFAYNAPNSNVQSSDKPHGFKAGDKITSTLNGSTLIDIVSVVDDYNFRFNYSGASSYPVTFTQPTTVEKNQWLNTSAYFGNETVLYNGIRYYCVRDIAANQAGNNTPNSSSLWTTVEPTINWSTYTDYSQLSDWASGTTYYVNDLVKVAVNGNADNTVFYICKKQHLSTSSAQNNPIANTTNWTKVIYTTPISVDKIKNHTSTDTYVIEVFAKTLGGNSTTAPAVDMPYKFSIRFPDETSKVYSGVIPGLTIGTAANAVPKLQIVKTTTAGVSSYVITHFE
jgi:hypothetical protein